MKLSHNCKACGKNDFKEIKEIKPEKIGNKEKIVCCCIHCGARVEAMRPYSLQKTLEEEKQRQLKETLDRQKGKDWDYGIGH